MPHIKQSLRKELAQGKPHPTLPKPRKAAFKSGGAVGQHKEMAIGGGGCKCGGMAMKKGAKY